MLPATAQRPWLASRQGGRRDKESFSGMISARRTPGLSGAGHCVSTLGGKGPSGGSMPARASSGRSWRSSRVTRSFCPRTMP